MQRPSEPIDVPFGSRIDPFRPSMASPISNPRFPWASPVAPIQDDQRSARQGQTSISPSISFSETLRSLYLRENFNLSPKLHQRVAELLALESGWDGENAMPLRPEALANAIALLIFMKASLPSFKEPFIAPTIDGYLQFEWHSGTKTLEFEATPNGWSIVGTHKTTNGEKIYHLADATRSHIEKLTAAFGWFNGSELLWSIP